MGPGVPEGTGQRKHCHHLTRGRCFLRSFLSLTKIGQYSLKPLSNCARRVLLIVLPVTLFGRSQVFHESPFAGAKRGSPPSALFSVWEHCKTGTEKSRGVNRHKNRSIETQSLLSWEGDPIRRETHIKGDMKTKTIFDGVILTIWA